MGDCEKKAGKEIILKEDCYAGDGKKCGNGSSELS